MSSHEMERIRKTTIISKQKKNLNPFESIRQTYESGLKIGITLRRKKNEENHESYFFK
jgi:hypothetical protein